MTCIAISSAARSPIIDSLKHTLTLTEGPARVKVLTDLAWYTKEEKHFSEAEAYAWQARHMAESYQDGKGKANAWNVLGLVDYNRSLNDSAIMFFDSALVVFRQTLDTTGIIAVLNNKGQLLGSIGRCTVSLPLLNEAIGLLLHQQKNITKRLTSLRINQISALLYCYHYETAVKLGTALLEEIQDRSDKKFRLEEGILYDVVGVAYIELKQADKALEYIRKAEVIMRETGHKHAEQVTRANQGMALVALKRYPEAIKIFEETKGEYGETLINDGVSEMNLATALTKVHRYKEALALSKEGIKKIEARGEIAPLPRAYRALAASLAGVGDSAAAYTPLMKATLLNDSLKDLQIAGRIQELTAEFETERIQFALENAQLDIQLNQQRIFLLSSALGAVMLIGALAYLIFYIRVRRRFYEARQRQTELEYSVLRSQMNPHFIFNALNSIQGFFGDQDFIRGNEYLGAFAFLMRRVLNQSARKEISLEEEIETLKLYLELEQARLGQQLTYEIETTPSIDAAWLKVPPLIIQPFAENAIWHGIAPKQSPGHIHIHIGLNKAETHLECIILDDGVGLNQNSNSHPHQSKGIAITQERLGTNGKVRVRNRTDRQGVESYLAIPI
ncbi:MAG: histidine kinase [Bacteroidota bacterium]